MMKKLSFVLALIIACGTLAACGGDSNGTTAPKGSSNPPKQSDSAPANSSDKPANTTQKPGSTAKPGTTKPAETTTPPENEDKPRDELIDGTKFKVDGDLSEWEGLASIELKGMGTTLEVPDTAEKGVTFYGVMTTTGLYLACDVYHNLYVTDQSVWYNNSNLELYVSAYTEKERVYVWAAGLDADCKTGAGSAATTGVFLPLLVVTLLTASAFA